MRLERRIRRFVQRELLDGHGVDGDPLSQGLDSLDIEQLVAFLEEEFDVVLSNEDVIGENFESVETLAELVRRKRRRQ